MANIKKYICLLLLLFVASLSCGCENTNSKSQDSNSNISEPQDISSQSHIVQTDISDISNTADSSYHSDNSVPKEWLPVYTLTDALSHYDGIANIDCSDSDISEQILSLVNKNVLFFAAITGQSFEIDWDNPSKTEIAETEVYPIKSQYFTDTESIYDLAFDTYKSSVAETFLGTKDNPRLFFTDKDNKLYVNPNNLSNWSSNPFYAETYIEITNISDDRCNFVWRFPDLEGLNEADEFQYFYFEKHYSAEYYDGKWVLNDIILNNNLNY